ncbi:amino acid adenylation domain-containing protein, partial [Steroidobacter flavus]
GVLGTLKAGGAYVPLDPNYPAERLRYMIEDAAPQVLLIQAQVRERLPATSIETVALDDDWIEIAHEASSDLSRTEQRANQLAYVIYTSGSTGQPKGVMIEHRQVLNLWQGLEQLYAQVGGCQRVALNASFNFDASVQQFVQLLSGRTLLLVPQEHRRDASALLEFVADHQVDAIDCTPSQLRSWIYADLLEKRRTLRMVLVGGEAIDAPLWSQLSQCSSIDFFNVYGPTECTVDATVAHLNGDNTFPHIGRPMPNRRVYILDRQNQPMPIGVTGEIYIGGAGVARGYLNREALTAERFVRDPFSADAQARMYKTGDLGRWRSDGTIEYLGRNDDQVKIRGYRIELGEIEAQLLEQPHVKEAAVIAREDTPGEKRLVAYYTVDEAVDLETLRTHLKGSLPEYMVPSAFVALERWPLTPNGKLDRRALPAPDVGAYTTRQYEAPQGEVEEILVGIWQSLLQV